MVCFRFHLSNIVESRRIHLYIMASRLYQLPDLLAGCPQKSASFNINAHKALVHQNCGKSCLISQDRDGDGCKNHEAEAVLSVGFCFPQADAKAFQAIADYFELGFIQEGATDAASVEDARKYMDMFSFTIALMEHLGEVYREDFLNAHSGYVQGVLQEALDRKRAQDTDAKLDVDTYLVNRRKTIAVTMCIVLTRSSGRLNISRDLLNEPSVRGMEEATVELIMIANDIYSYKKELAEGNARHNIITVLTQDPKTKHLSLQSAIDYAGQLFELALARFEESRASIPSFDEETDKMLEEYAVAMVGLFVGNIEWCCVSARYRVFDSEGNRQKGLVELCG
ncbi:isoprenoid synthase domain-containing protein [Hygrophoropsis aurantiaca]|uniref:Isoprenoid synthase domain-containing protein n=1 Tax=Hygrophoropsis aurantiaca TaxID=72124 RepID=A0ACB7ZU93_9AGAM|nr:isoprenoid synthase domain-containing protein [Hygrophoropsis aurantiaca]